MTNIKKSQSLREYADLHRCNEFYKKVFGAVEESRFTMPDDNTKIIHAVLKIGKNDNSRIMLADEFPRMCDSSIF
jgi:uncharacterized glyoxalase superfamily protein PhnB